MVLMNLKHNLNVEKMIALLYIQQCYVYEFQTFDCKARYKFKT